MTRPDRRPVTLRTGRLETPIGAVLLVTDPEGRLCAAEFADVPWRLDRHLARRFAHCGYRLVEDGTASADARALDAYFAGALDALTMIEPRLDGTPFQIAVWQALRTTVPGRTLTYRALAERLGRPGASRAVGHANGANPLSIVVPCHRLVGTSGELTGYGGGLDRKRWLLAHEARHAGRAPTPPGDAHATRISLTAPTISGDGRPDR